MKQSLKLALSATVALAAFSTFSTPSYSTPIKIDPMFDAILDGFGDTRNDNSGKHRKWSGWCTANNVYPCPPNSWTGGYCQWLDYQFEDQYECSDSDYPEPPPIICSSRVTPANPL